MLLSALEVRKVSIGGVFCMVTAGKTAFLNLKQKTMENINELVLAWANERGLLKAENATKQALKLTEEVGELASAILKSKPEEQIDAIGDIQVVLIILSKQLGIDYNLALESAYNVIANRKGQTVNGIFIKE